MDKVYDCIFTEKDCVEILLKNWIRLDMKKGSFLAPWKIRVRNWDFFDAFQEEFLKIKNYCPRMSSFGDIWEIRDSEPCQLIHLSIKEDLLWHQKNPI